MKKMNKIFVLYLFLIIQSLSFSQNADSLNKPFFELSDNFILAYNFPACNLNGDKILIVHSNYSCCIGLKTELFVMNRFNINDYESILINNGEVEEPFDLNSSTKIFKKINKILKKSDFYTLPQLTDYQTNYDSITNKQNIQFIYKNENYNSDLFEIPKHYTSGFCCTGIFNDSVNCITNQEINKIWINTDYNFLLLEYGIVNCADGCEVGPWYLITDFK